MLKMIKALTKPLFSDRQLPPVAGTSAAAFEELYAGKPDPWGVLTSPVAHERALALLEVVGEYSPCGSILDAGCGEGALTRYLVGCAPKVVGIDASMTAISRAKRLVPRAQFECCALETFTAEGVFDVVLAVEVLYYVKDIPFAIERLRRLGRSVIVSYTNRERERFERDLAPFFPPDRRTYYPFFGLKKHGFTVARLD